MSLIGKYSSKHVAMDSPVFSVTADSKHLHDALEQIRVTQIVNDPAHKFELEVKIEEITERKEQSVEVSQMKQSVSL